MNYFMINHTSSIYIFLRHSDRNCLWTELSQDANVGGRKSNWMKLSPDAKVGTQLSWTQMSPGAIVGLRPISGSC